jgi:hypothetical protein
MSNYPPAELGGFRSVSRPKRLVGPLTRPRCLLAT